jgi:fused signal recognition particle receptor
MLFWKKKKKQDESEEQPTLDSRQEEQSEAEEPIEETASEQQPIEEVVTEETVVAKPDEGEAEEIEEAIEEIVGETEEEAVSEAVFEAEEEEEKKKGFFSRLKDGLGKTRSSLADKVGGVFKSFKKIDEEFYEELEEALILADIGMTTSIEIVERLRERVKEKKLTEEDEVKRELRDIVAEILDTEDSELKTDTKPTVILMIGVNGVGKTTTIGKLASKLKAEGKSVVLAAADTFRAAAADQLEIWAERNDVRLVRLQEGADPAAVIFDGCVSARSKGADVLICDTAGRLHNKKNLMDELKKIYRVIERELPGARREVLLVLDATTGQNAVNQAEEFNNAAGITGIVLTKLDGTAKGGIIITIREKLGIPVKFVGVGEGIDDLQKFDAKAFADALFFE